MSWVKSKKPQQFKIQPLNQPSSFNDPYQAYLLSQQANKNLIPHDPSSKFSKKMTILKQKMQQAKYNALNGAMMGFMVGGLFGLVVGIYSAFQTRRLISIPISIVVSGCSFGFILGCGSMIRNTDTALKKQGQWIKISKWNTQMII